MTHPSPTEAAAEAAELTAYVRRSLRQTLLFLVALFAAVGVCSALYEAELLNATAWTYERLGLLGLLGLVVFADAIASPIPPDVVLVVVSKTELHANWPGVVLLIGALSSVAGCGGYFLGKSLKSTAWVASRLRRRRLQRALVARYGRWAVALGALTPIPFSVTCWLAGIFGMPLREFAPITLLRVPRFFVYYGLIVAAERWFGG